MNCKFAFLIPAKNMQGGACGRREEGCMPCIKKARYF